MTFHVHVGGGVKLEQGMLISASKALASSQAPQCPAAGPAAPASSQGNVPGAAQGPSPRTPERRPRSRSPETSSDVRRVRQRVGKADRDVVLSAVQHRGMALQFASAELRGDCDVVFAAVWQSCWALQFASAELRGDRDVVLAAVRRDGRAFRFASAELRGDRDFVLAVVHRDWSALQFASCELWDNRDVVLAAVQRDYRALRFASAQLRGYLERWALMVLAGVQKNSRKKRALENAPVDGFRPKRQQTESLAA